MLRMRARETRGTAVKRTRPVSCGGTVVAPRMQFENHDSRLQYNKINAIAVNHLLAHHDGGEHVSSYEHAPKTTIERPFLLVDSDAVMNSAAVRQNQIFSTRAPVAANSWPELRLIAFSTPGQILCDRRRVALRGDTFGLVGLDRHIRVPRPLFEVECDHVGLEENSSPLEGPYG